MESLILYLTFATTTGICSWIFYYRPILFEAKNLQINNSFVRNPILSSIIYIILSILIAPGIFMPLFDKNQEIQFCNALKKEMFKQD
jgi:hypothetical protein